MKKIFLLLPFLAACHPTFHKEWAQERLKMDYEQVKLSDYMEYPNCSEAHTFATAWSGINRSGQPVQGVICCTYVNIKQNNQCMIFEKK